MQLYLLHLDDALKSQTDFMNTCDRYGAKHIHAKNEGSTVRLWGKTPALIELQNLLQKQWKSDHTPPLCFMGSGDFHHITTYLLASALKHSTAPVTVIHFDNHPDWVAFEDGIHCGSWVNKALEYPQVTKVITVGVCSHDLRLPEWKGASLKLLSQGLLELYPFEHAPSRVRQDYGYNPCFTQKDGHLHWKTIRSMSEQEFDDYLLSRIATANVYITIDKDVLAREDAITNWDQGQMRLPHLLTLIQKIAANHTIIGADVTGDYSQPHYSGSILTKIAKKAEILIDQPCCRPKQCDRNHVNSAANHALLEVLSEAMS